MAIGSHYERLNVAEQASEEDIRAAWRAEVARQRGMASHSPIAQAVALADIHAAYEVLSNPKRRARYDKKLATHRGDPATDGLPLHSANDEDSTTELPTAVVPEPQAATARSLAASLRMAESLRGMLTHLGNDMAKPRLWPSSPLGMAVVMGMVAVLAAWLALSSDATAPNNSQSRAQMRRLSPQARQAHVQWLLTARTDSHPLDGESLRLRR